MGRNLLKGKFFDFSKEREIYSYWEKEKKFQPSGEGNPYFIPMPPPNITGRLHAGHALFLTIQDILIRFHRKQGFDTLWLPGTDHAGLATQEKIEKEMNEKNIPLEDFEIFSQKYKDKNNSEIIHQIKSMGSSCDWDRYCFTLDDKFKKAILTALIEINKDGLLYEKDGQWYIDMSSFAFDLSQAIEKKEIIIIPEYEALKLQEFLKNIEPWCISRQIQWGHKIPIWTKGDDIKISDENIEGYSRIPGCLDTWFSSALYPFASLGWPEDTEDYKRYYPASLIETGSDILFFWCARMLMMGKYLTGQYPFKKIFLHGILTDENGEKMSKSLGNGIDPLSIIEKYGCDALRFALAENTSFKQTQLYDEKFESAKSLINKLWNCSKFMQKHIMSGMISDEYQEEYYKIQEIIKEIENHYYQMEFAQSCFKIRKLLFETFSSDLIEKYKQELFNGNENTKIFMSKVLFDIIEIMEPIIPFICFEIKKSL